MLMKNPFRRSHLAPAPFMLQRKFASCRTVSRPRQPSLARVASALVGAMTLTTLLAPSPGRTEVLYSLATTCSLAAAAPVPCTVEAENASADKVTLYRHRIGATVETLRITDDPVTITRWNQASKSWEKVTNAAARFSTNTICFNDRELCVVNPNYLNSIREDRANTRLAGRDLVRVHFGPDGRVDASCYDSGCEVLNK